MPVHVPIGNNNPCTPVPIINNVKPPIVRVPIFKGSSWLYGSWMYKCNRCLSPLILWVLIPLRRGVLDTTLCDKVCQWFAARRWFSPGTPVSSTNKTDRHDIAEILLKVALNTITKPQYLTTTFYSTYSETLWGHEPFSL